MNAERDTPPSTLVASLMSEIHLENAFFIHCEDCIKAEASVVTLKEVKFVGCQVTCIKATSDSELMILQSSVLGYETCNTSKHSEMFFFCITPRNRKNSLKKGELFSQTMPPVKCFFFSPIKVVWMEKQHNSQLQRHTLEYVSTRI